MKAIGYIRVSTAQQSEQGVSLQDQAEKIEEYCDFKDLNLVEIIADKGISGGVPLASREGGQKLFHSIAENKIDVVVSVKLDRLFRDAADCLNTSKEWDNKGIALHLLDLGGSTLDTSTAMGRMFLTISASFAEMEKNLIQERTRNALQYKKNNREVYGSTPTGYDRRGDKLVKNDNEIAMIKYIKKLRDAGETLQSIATKLNENGFKTKRGGKKWYASTVSYILKNNLYKEVV